MIRFIIGFVFLLHKVFDYLRQGQLINLGKDRQELEQRKQIEARLKKVDDARNDAAKLDRVRDKYVRK